MKISTPLRIIIADDDPDDLEYMKFLFESHKNFEIIGCHKSGLETLETLNGLDHAPDLLLIDMYMPILTGTEVVENLIAKDIAQSMHIFIISTTINPNEQEKFQDNPKIEFLEKPLTLVQINDLPGIILEKLNADNTNRI